MALRGITHRNNRVSNPSPKSMERIRWSWEELSSFGGQLLVRSLLSPTHLMILVGEYATSNTKLL